MNVEKEVDYVDLSTDKTPHYVLLFLKIKTLGKIKVKQ